MGWRQACFSHNVSAKFYIRSLLFLNKAPSLYYLWLSSEMHLDRFSQSSEHDIIFFQSYEAIPNQTSMQRKVSQNSKLIQISLLKIPPENRITVTVRSQKGHQARGTSAWPHCPSSAQQWLLCSHAGCPYPPLAAQLCHCCSPEPMGAL